MEIKDKRCSLPLKKRVWIDKKQTFESHWNWGDVLINPFYC